MLLTLNIWFHFLIKFTSESSRRLKKLQWDRAVIPRLVKQVVIRQLLDIQITQQISSPQISFVLLQSSLRESLQSSVFLSHHEVHQAEWWQSLSAVNSWMKCFIINKSDARHSFGDLNYRVVFEPREYCSEP